jgi:hypothetical protein
MATTTTPSTGSAQHTSKGQHSDRLARGTSGASERMLPEGQESLDAFVSMLQPIGDFSLKALRTTVDYARRHPMRIAVTVVAVGLLGTMLARTRMSSNLH